MPKRECRVAVSGRQRELGERAAPQAVDRQGLGRVLAASVVVALLVPVLNLAVPAGSAFHLSEYAVQLIAKITCCALAALAMDLLWGYTGVLSLGHGVFFALGGYAIRIYPMRQIGRDGNYQSDLPTS